MPAWRSLVLLAAALCTQVAGQSSSFSSSSSLGGLGGGLDGGLGGLGGSGGLGGLGGSGGLGGLDGLDGLGGGGGLPNIVPLPPVSGGSLSLPNPSSIIKIFGNVDLLRPLLLGLAPLIFQLLLSSTPMTGSISPYLFLGIYPFIVRFLPEILKGVSGGSGGGKGWGRAVYDAIRKVAFNKYNILPFLIPFLLGGGSMVPPPPTPKNGNQIIRILSKILRVGSNPPSPSKAPPKLFGLLSLPPPGAILLFYFWPYLLQLWNWGVYQLLRVVWGYVQSVKYNPLPFIINGLFGRNRSGPPKLPNIPQPPNWLFKG